MSKAPLMPRLPVLQYRVLGTLGTGAGSTILLISDKSTGERFALKVVRRQDEEDDVYIDQALHEFEVLRRLGHSTIVRAFDCRVRRNWRFKASGVELLMEFIDGRTIDEV